MTEPCHCSQSSKLVFACSGAADVGALADQVARRLTRDHKGKMFCLAGVGGRIGAIMKTAASADTILAIDGCRLNCVKKCLETAGIAKFKHLQVADLGLEKGETPVNEDSIQYVENKAIELLG